MASSHALRHHRSATGRPLSHVATATVLVGSVFLGTGIAQAAPEQGGVSPNGNQQGGVSPDAPAPEQGGVTPEAPAPETSPAPETTTPEPDYDPGPGIAPSPPSGQWIDQTPEQSAPQTNYNPIPQGPLHAPRPTPPVKRIKPAPDHLRVGNASIPVKQIPFPSFMSKKDQAKVVVSGNEWSAFEEAEIARFLISVGVPPDQASRQAAATIMGATASGLVGGTVVFVVTTGVVGLVTVPLGAAIGTGVGAALSGGNPMATLGGTGLGAAAGGGVALAAGGGAGLVAALLSAAAGGTLAYLLGAGDPGAHPARPDSPWQQNGPGKHRKVEIVDPGANQYEVHLPAEQAKRAGLPKVDYVVTQRGDVNIDVGGTKVGWTAEQAQAPVKAIEKVAPQASKVINDGVKNVSDAVSKAVPQLKITWPQEKKPAAKHSAKKR